MSEKTSLKSKAISGAIWSFIDVTGTQGLQVIVQIVLARLLFPEDFGIIGMVTVFVAISQAFIDSGFMQGLIREKKVKHEDYSTVFLFNLVIAVLLYSVFFVSADLISQFFGYSEIVPIIRVLSIILVINAFGLIQRTMLMKNVNFKAIAKINLISVFFSGIIAIVMAALGFGVWSLVVKTVFMQFIKAVLFSFYNRWIPKLVFNFESFTRIFNFGWKLLLSRILTTIYQNIYYLIIGRGFTATDLGHYTNAKKLKDAAANTITISVQKVSYPVLSNIQNDSARLKRGYKQIIKNSVFVIFPVMLGLSAVAPALFRVVLGEKWIAATPYFQILCLAGMLFPLHAINLNILQVKGRSDLYLLVSVLKKIVGLTFIGIVLFLGLGIMGLMWSAVVTSYLSYFINAFYSKKVISYSVFEQIKDISLYYLLSGAMAFIVFSMNYIFNINDIILLFIQICVGVSIYVGINLILKTTEYKTILTILKENYHRIVSRKSTISESGEIYEKN
ncbi:lipopolysaccharide biosynthesis protein [Herbivorax sp. ANBcel31]|uniref:lipopolysaccharide biosynthesis protein n=1 Tax=Herbivorax sp. ANBcel31 TaxID=3069754 RepID=UPI0027AF8B14|nr:lipopolysaccharide biosynthesis protein [Herbivorax sp. ANBcel31]MDQ2085659.1 lipopolysaccharide biosynthesis protein [Herbivorax sp. ANBcel31]